MKTAAELALAAEWEQAKGRLPGPAGLRETAFQRFAAQGLPHRRVEEWKYTDLRALMRDAKPLAAPPDAAAIARARTAGSVLDDVTCRRIVFVDGTFAPQFSDLTGLEQGLTIRPMAQALAAGDPLIDKHLGKVIPVEGDPAVSLNTAFMGDGALIHLGPGASIDRPLNLVFLAAGDKPAAMFTRSLVVVEKGARAMLIESHEVAGGADYQVNAALELVVADAAHVDHVKIVGEGANALHVSTLMAKVGAHARFNDFSFICPHTSPPPPPPLPPPASGGGKGGGQAGEGRVGGGALVRNQLYLHFHGNETVAAIRGVNLLKDKQHADTTMVVEHDSLGCQSRELFKSVLDGESRCVFQGKIVVKPHAQQTDAKMMTQALLLSEQAEADNKPELEIFADDVQCGHGATTGDLDEDLLFYLRARGIPQKEAEALLIQAFVGEAVEGIEHARLREVLMDAAVKWLRERE
jgi:Fe-S cluster assembly protein SufD